MAWHTRTCHWFVFNHSYPPLYFMESNKDLTWMSYDNSVSSARISLRYSTSIITSAKIQLHASPSGSMPQCQCNSGHSNTTTWLTLRGSIAAQEKIRTLTYAAGLIGHHVFYILVVWLWSLLTSKSTKFIQGLFASNMDHYKLRSESQLWISCTTARRALVLELWVKRYLTLKWSKFLPLFTYLSYSKMFIIYIECQHIQFFPLS